MQTFDMLARPEHRSPPATVVTTEPVTGVATVGLEDRMRNLTKLALFAAALGCAEDMAEDAHLRVDDISSSEVVVGETLDFYGHGFLGGDEGSTRLRFSGTFYATDGSEEAVQFAVTPLLNGDLGDDELEPTQVLTWSRFGPYVNPFTGTATHGTFRGEVMPEVTAEDGTILTGQAKKLELKVAPHVVIEAFEPLEAACGAPAMRALPGIPYVLRVRTVGIQATRFVYQLSKVNGAEGATTFEHDFGRGVPVASDELGRDEPIIFNPIASGQQSYVTAIRVLAYDDKNNAVETVLPTSVHRPIEVAYGGTYEMAELYEPIPVSGCTPGSIGTRVEYSESVTETRQQSVSVTVSNDWARQEGRSVSSSTHEGIALGESRSQSLGGSEWEGESTERTQGVTYSQSETNRVGYSSSDGENWSWNMSEGETNEEYESRMNSIFGEGSISGTVGASAEGSIPGFAKVSGSVETTAGVTAGASTAGTRGSRRGTSRSRGWGASGTHEETRSFGSASTESQTESLSGSYGLTRSRSRNFNDTETRSMARTWDVSQGQVDDESVSVGQSESEAETWVSSESVTVGIGFGGNIPATKAGQFYRQTQRWVRRAEVRAYDLCGLANHMGELQFNEWTWSVDLAIGESCNGAALETSLPAARCIIPPCGG